MRIKIIDFGYENLPKRAHHNDAGADVYVCFHDKKSVVVTPGETCKVPLPTLESLINPEKLGATKSCDEIVLTVFGISMTLLSFLISAFLFWISSLSIVLRLSYKQTEL